LEPRIGVLSLQGGFGAHLAALRETGAAAAEVKTARDLDLVDGLIIPGGESTTMRLLLAEKDLLPSLLRRAHSGMPVFGTCAGAILVAKRILSPDAPGLGLIDADVERNAYGRQIDSFVSATDPGPSPFSGLECVFIRAPRIRRLGQGVSVLATHRGEPVLVREGNVFAATFHPELSRDRSIHRAFLDATASSRIATA
jgi:5'-phosphate synthase pdxT subunit